MSELHQNKVSLPVIKRLPKYYRYLSEMHHGYGRASSYDGNGSACVNRNNDCIRNFPGKLFVCCFWQYLGFGSLIGFPSMSQRSLYSLEMDLVYRC